MPICAVTQDLNRYLDEQDRLDEIDKYAESHNLTVEEAEKELQELHEEAMIERFLAQRADFDDRY